MKLNITLESSCLQRLATACSLVARHDSRRRFTSGFTLIELLVVISIIGILAALLLANMAGIRDRADDARVKSNMKQLQNALRLYYNDTGKYPLGTSLPNLTEYADANLASDLIAKHMVYNGSGADAYWACVPLTNPNDREQEVPGSTGKCADNLSDAAGPHFCICAK